MSTLSTLLEQNLSEAFSLEAMPETERDSFLEEVGEVVLRRAISEFISLLDDEEQTKFQTFVERNVGDVLFFNRLLEEYPTFMPIFEGVILQFKFEVIELENKT